MSPFWTHSKVTVTPHNAATSDPRTLVADILRQIERIEAGLPLEHVSDRSAGYWFPSRFPPGTKWSMVRSIREKGKRPWMRGFSAESSRR